MKIIITSFILLFLAACGNEQSTSNKKTPGFKINKSQYDIAQPLTITGINEFDLDSSIIRENRIKQYICYIEYNDISFLSRPKDEWRKYSSCTFDTAGNWADFKRFDYAASVELVSTTRSNTKRNDRYSSGYWKGQEYFYKGDSIFIYQKYKVVNDSGFLKYDSLVTFFKDESNTYVNIYENDTVIYKSEKVEPYRKVFYRNSKGQVVKTHKVDKRGIYEVAYFEYANDYLVKVIRQNLVDMTESIYIDVIEYNDLMLPVNFKCYALDNSINAISEYNLGKRKANKIIELKVEWLK